MLPLCCPVYSRHHRGAADFANDSKISSPSLFCFLPSSLKVPLSLHDGGEQKETTSSQTAGWSGDHLRRAAKKKKCSNTAANSVRGGHGTQDAGCCRHGCVTLWTRQTKRGGGGGGRRERGDGEGGCVGCGGRTVHSDTSLMNILKGPLS